MNLRLVGLYTLASRGGDTEKLILASNGLDAEILCPVAECTKLWNTVVDKCILYCFC